MEKSREFVNKPDKLPIIIAVMVIYLIAGFSFKFVLPKECKEWDLTSNIERRTDVLQELKPIIDSNPGISFQHAVLIKRDEVSKKLDSECENWCWIKKYAWKSYRCSPVLSSVLGILFYMDFAVVVITTLIVSATFVIYYIDEHFKHFTN